ncbi:PREDICTED: cytoplasmic dynein 1 light intermediate chain 1-like, partial [Amphimedon queenslandica]|uniref:Dynein light intermediate chain n=1 Tax=Amphimedon queenslandica TaxID=400682 RepID=A0AAN0IRL1_AMPQE
VKSFQSYVDPEVQGSSSLKDDEDVSLPLEEHTLSCNLGIQLVVVCAKSDCFVQLEKNEKYQDEHFDFLQQHIRKFCLNYGAALVYVSTKDNKNIDILHKYLIHKAYGLKFKVPAYTVERDAVFIPAGWDSSKRIAVLCEQIKHFNSREPLNNIIKSPPLTTTTSQQSENISSEDDQVLLLAQQ